MYNPAPTMTVFLLFKDTDKYSFMYSRVECRALVTVICGQEDEIMVWSDLIIAQFMQDDFNF